MDQDNYDNNNKSSNSDGVSAEKSCSMSYDQVYDEVYNRVSRIVDSIDINDIHTNDNSDNNIKKNTCLYCLTEVEGSMRCSRCETGRYCGKECQVKHWPVHKNSCLDSNNTEDSNDKLDTKAFNHFNQGSYLNTKVSSLSSLIQ
jgi:hypothetical protein